ncbi:MAG TPA: hypothetical protein VF575_04940 [Candidatus Saccharimonadales bacterium]|jgi:hypothetical protein
MDGQNQTSEDTANSDPHGSVVISPTVPQNPAPAIVSPTLPSPLAPQQTIQLTAAPSAAPAPATNAPAPVAQPAVEPYRAVEPPKPTAAPNPVSVPSSSQAENSSVPLAAGAAFQAQPQSTSPVNAPAFPQSQESNPYAIPLDEAYVPDGGTQNAPDGSQAISWTAAEFAHHPKQMYWYVVLATIAAFAAILTYVISDIVTSIVVVVCAGLFGYMASRQPRDLNFALDSTGILVGTKHYPYAEFSTFSIFEDGDHCSIDFAPLKRFAPVLTISYVREQEDEIMYVLNQHLPFSNHKRTMIDTLMHRIGF